MEEDYKRFGIEDLVAKGDFEGAVELIKGLGDFSLRWEMCVRGVIHVGFLKAEEELGEIVILKDREEYEKSKRGMGKYPPDGVLLSEEDGNIVEGISTIVEFVSENNPLMKSF